MTKFKCIIVDDEPIAIRIIKNHLFNFDEFEVVAECLNAIEALKVLRSHHIDLMFLDIDMPSLTGLEMIQTRLDLPNVIFTTAHRHYAVDAFEVNALDYLLKPVSLERFTKAINRFFDLKTVMIDKSESVEDKWLMLKVDKKNLKVSFSDIFYIESMADYVVVHLSDKKLVTKERISHFEAKLPVLDFFRVHRGYIVNTYKIEAVYGNTIEVAGEKIPVGRSYKEKLGELFKNQS